LRRRNTKDDERRFGRTRRCARWGGIHQVIRFPLHNRRHSPAERDIRAGATRLTWCIAAPHSDRRSIYLYLAGAASVRCGAALVACRDQIRSCLSWDFSAIPAPQRHQQPLSQHRAKPPGCIGLLEETRRRRIRRRRRRAPAQEHRIADRLRRDQSRCRRLVVKVFCTTLMQ
jgi:hypothetical protein